MHENKKHFCFDCYLFFDRKEYIYDKDPSPNYCLTCLFIGSSVHRLYRNWLILNASHNDPQTREPVGARFVRKREMGADGFTRQWSLALSDNLETVRKYT